MDERIVQFRVGVMVLATLIITGILVLLFGKMPKFVQGTYTVYITFPDAPGVTADTPVRRSGLLIGRVTNVKINEDETVTVTAEINSDVKLRKYHVCRLVTTLLGDSTLEFVRREKPPAAAEPRPAGGVHAKGADEPVPPGPTQPDDALLEPGAHLQGEVASDPLQVLSNLEADAHRMIDSVAEASGDVSHTARRLTALVDENDEQFGRILSQTETTLKSVQTAAESTQSLLGDPELKSGLKQTMQDLPAVFREAREAIDHMDHTLELADHNLENLQAFTEPLGRRSEQMFDRMDRGAEKLGLILDQLSAFSEALNNDEGSLGRFLHDPSLYDNLNSAACNVDRLTREMRPIVNDVRVFTDKIARDPGRLGVRGVFQQTNGVK